MTSDEELEQLKASDPNLYNEVKAERLVLKAIGDLENDLYPPDGSFTIVIAKMGLLHQAGIMSDKGWIWTSGHVPEAIAYAFAESMSSKFGMKIISPTKDTTEPLDKKDDGVILEVTFRNQKIQRITIQTPSHSIELTMHEAEDLRKQLDYMLAGFS